MTATGGTRAHPNERPASSQERAPERATPPDDGERWADSWRANEIRWLQTRVAYLERQLRRRTTALAVTFVVGGFVAGVAVGAAVVLVDGAEPGWIGRIADGGPATDRASPETERPEPAATPAQPDLVTRALEAANEEIEAAIERLADDQER